MARPRQLSRELIADAALRVGDRVGPQAMTMRQIAAELKCDPMAIYRHFANREELLDFVVDLSLADVALPDLGLPWDERVAVIGQAMRDAGASHPGLTAHMAARPPLGPNGQRLAGAVLMALDEGGLPAAMALHVLQTLIAYLSASLAMTAQAGGVRDERWTQVMAMFGRLPESSAEAEMFAAGSQEQFEFGLRLLLAGVRSQATAASGS
ncbi:TetR/AcrR family transcriptional regulator [Kribbella sp. NPDC056345]|uniref:TetR/AcrR family transcriptional regulator n=1 Tax=Kribbella sp. NPDC056345 TaxID=3345789 RepID=UPI0035DA40E6